MAELEERIQTAVGDTYRIERELGGGGMSRVFLAEEVKLGRRVVIKVLPPEMAAGVNQERFHREIQLAANLQHPHIVSLLTAGAQDDLLYYVMPYIKGESLRAKLAREGELPVGETVRILKEVIDALAYAHREGVVHRDIKPDNVLLSEGHAVVTDFGVAKAVTASSGSSSLTSLGVALGTPAYMAPEQAAADPHTDHRADIYAVGTLAYEMLCGEPPFTGPTPQAVMAAHMSDAVEPVSSKRPAVSDVLNSLIMRCLEKRAADRWQKAEELLPHLDAILTPTSGITPTGTAPLPAVDYEARARQARPVRVAALFGLASVGALAIVYLLVQQLGLPGWVFVGAIGLLIVGLPIMMLTGHHERRRAVARATGMHVATPTGVQRHFTWRRSLLGGGLAFAGLGLLATLYMVTRALGIGPAATLVSSGVLAEQAQIVLADFEDRTGDSTLASALTEAFRVDLGQSRIVTLMPEGDVAAALMRMRHSPAGHFDLEIARQLAIREGTSAVVTGEINRAGAGFVLTVSLVEPASGNELAGFRETASDETQVIPAIDRLSRTMRERIGESFKTMRAQAGLDRVTTQSLEALRKYSQGIRVEQSGNEELAEDLFEEAIALDSTFAMAWRKLSVVIANTGGLRSRSVHAATRAYELRDRLPELERYQTTGFYYLDIDLERAIATYRAGLERFPDDPTLLANGAYALNSVRRYAEAESLAARGHAYGASAWDNQIQAQVAQGNFAAAESTVSEFASTRPNSPFLPFSRATVAYGQRDFARGDDLLAPVLDSPEAPLRSFAAQMLGASLTVRGRLVEGDALWRAAMQGEADRGIPTQYIWLAAAIARRDLRYLGPTADALRVVDEALTRFPLSDLDPLDRPYTVLAQVLAEAGRVDDARRLLAEYEATVPEEYRVGDSGTYTAQAALAMAEGRPRDAIEAIRTLYLRAGVGGCGHCPLYQLGRALDAAGMTDSARVVLERAVSSSGDQYLTVEPFELPHAYQRLGEIYEAQGDREKAVEYYNRFVELWNDADAELQPQVEDVRGRIARLVGERR